MKKLHRGKAKPELSNDQQTEVIEIIEQSLRQHLSRINSHYATTSGFHAMKTRWDKLLRPDILAFAVSTIDQELRKSLTDHLHHYQARRFGDIYVAVSTIPAVNPSEARAYFDYGYFGFIDLLFNECDYGVGNLDLAHWIFCYDGKQQVVHLTFMPAMKMIKTQGSNTISVLAQDLMTVAERSQAGNV